MKPDEQFWEVKIERVQFHKCDLCPKAFINSDGLTTHAKVHENRFLEHALSSYVKIEKVDFFNCDSCRQSFLSKKELLLHRVKHIHKSVIHSSKRSLYDNKSIPKPYQCPECDYRFVAESTLEAHSIVHQPYPHICFCGIGYYKEEDLKHHIKLVKCKPKIEDNDKNHIKKIRKSNEATKVLNEVIKPNGILKVGDKEQKDIIKVKLSFKSKQTKPKLETGVRRVRVREPLDVNFEADELGRYQCPKCSKFFNAKCNVDLHFRSVHRGERPYHCNQCSKSFSQSGVLKNHIRSVHEGQRNFKCHYCDKKFFCLDLQLRHERIHTGYKPHKCTFCEKAFSDPSAFTRHIRIHTGDKRYRCSLCPKAYTDHSALYAHKKRHANQRDYKCIKCGKKFYCGSALRKHNSAIHEHKLNYICDYCEKAFFAKGNLISHIQRHHYDQRESYRCNICLKTISSKANLRKHIKIVHEGIKEYSCEFCLKQYSSKCALLKHLPVHYNERKFECDHCNKRYNTKEVLRSHIINVHINIYCKECGRYFTCISDLKKHKLQVKESCDICDKQVSCKGALQSHILTHTKKENVYECDYCGIVFRTRQTIKDHILIHHCKPKFICEHCGQRFALKESIRSHMMCHLDVPRCDNCYRRFYTKIDFEKHSAGCTVMEHKCKVCDKSLKTAKSLQVHSLLHMGKRKLVKCPLCAKELYNKSSAVRHIGLVHGKKRKRVKKRYSSSSSWDDSE